MIRVRDYWDDRPPEVVESYDSPNDKDPYKTTAKIIRDTPAFQPILQAYGQAGVQLSEELCLFLLDCLFENIKPGDEQVKKFEEILMKDLFGLPEATE